VPHETAAILAIGDELALGQSLDTNSQWLSQRLASVGVRVVEHVTVEDDLERIAAAITRLAGEVDLLITSGGLGPTADDLTRQSLARALGDELVEDEGSLRQIEAVFAQAGRRMPEANRVQALRPSRALALANGNGTAPGMFVGEDGSRPSPRPPPRGRASMTSRPGWGDVFCLPGPPRELGPMFEAEVLPRVEPVLLVVTRTLHACGIGESDVAERLGELMERDRPVLVGTNASSGLVTIRVRAERSREADAAAVGREVDAVVERVRSTLGEFVFGEGDTTLEERVLGALRGRGESVATVESCTGGLLGAMLTSVGGSSESVVGGWVTYTNEMKHREVGVPMEVFERAGAVSRECAEGMALGGLERSGASHCLAITGVAGPSGGTEEKPVGTVWIARASGGGRDGAQVDARLFRFPGDRETVRRWSVATALVLLHRRLSGAEEPVRLLRELG